VVSHNISVVGTGYVGLCTAVGFASKGYKAITSTHDSEKASLINKGISPFFEPHLRELLQKVVKEGYLKCVLNREEAILNTDITFIAVATPKQPDGSINLQFIKEAACEIGDALKKKNGYHLAVVKSTVIPGTSETIVKPAIEKHSNKRCGNAFGLCMNPEFLREGSALEDTFYPDRIVVGEYDHKSGDILGALYKDFYKEDLPPIIRTTLSTAELIKYANNAFLATKISFINTIANLCKKIPGADVTTVAKAIGLDERIGPFFLNAGLGYGGSCFPKDVKALIAYSKGVGYDLKILNAVEEVNATQPLVAVELAEEMLGSLKDRRIAILGLAFKPNTDDMREAVSIKIIDKLLQERASVVAYDPIATRNAKEIFDNRITYASSEIECIKDADCCIVVTEWNEFKKLEPDDFIQSMRQPCLIDGRRIYDPKKFNSKLKFMAVGMGA